VQRLGLTEPFAALGPVDGPDVRGMPDGTLLHLRDTYPIETAWAPPWVGDKLRQVRVGAEHARLAAIRADAEAKTTHGRGQQGTAAKQETLAASYRAMHDAYREREAVFAGVMDDRADWEQAESLPTSAASASSTLPSSAWVHSPPIIWPLLMDSARSALLLRSKVSDASRG
jgi:hypothetical protein